MSEGKTIANVSARVIKHKDMSQKFEAVQLAQLGSVKKADDSTQITEADQILSSVNEGIIRPYDPLLLEKISRESTIVPQCINAYKVNVTGFGFRIDPADGLDDTAQDVAAEIKKAKEIVDMLFLDASFEESTGKQIADTERYGYSAYEVVRDASGNPVELIPFDDVPTLYMMARDQDPTEYIIKRNGKEVRRKKRFRRYFQRALTAGVYIPATAGQKVYFKEFGDPRSMDSKTGEYATTGMKAQNEANELIWLKAIDLGVYGVPRYEGTLLTEDGMRRSEKLNQSYFTKGRHTPLLIMVENGSLTEGAWTKLQEYIDDIQGESGQHAFMVLETEAIAPDTAIQDQAKMSIKIQDMAKVLQKDELFQDYQENGRKKTQSAFNLPDIYVAYTKDYNVATARVAVEKTEEQVFQPYRNRFEWMINNNILAEHDITKAIFKLNAPSIDNTEHQEKMFARAVEAGGITPKAAKAEYEKTVNRTLEDLPEAPWNDIPLQIYTSTVQSLEPSLDQVEKAIAKAENDKHEEIVGVLKQVRNVVKDLMESKGEE